MMLGLIDAVETAALDERVRVIVLTSANDDFCAGADIVARNAPGQPRPRVGSIQRRLPVQANRLITTLLTVQTPVVARVRGWAAGIGFHLALAADFCVAADVGPLLGAVPRSRLHPRQRRRVAAAAHRRREARA